MHIYFIRHGQTNYNLLDLCNDDPNVDVHLTEKGVGQAMKIKEKFRGKKFDLVITSELPRTRETALIITKDYKVEIKKESRINDRKTGFEGRPASEFFKKISPDMSNMKPEGGESFQEEKERVFSFLSDLKSYNYEDVLVVSHKEIMQIINGYFNNLSDQEMYDTEIDNCEVLEFNL